MADTTIEFEIKYLKGEIKSMHKMGLLVPSSLYERLHRLEKEKRKRDVEEKRNESNISNRHCR